MSLVVLGHVGVKKRATILIEPFFYSFKEVEPILIVFIVNETINKCTDHCANNWCYPKQP